MSRAPCRLAPCLPVGGSAGSSENVTDEIKCRMNINHGKGCQQSETYISRPDDDDDGGGGGLVVGPCGQTFAARGRWHGQLSMPRPRCHYLLVHSMHDLLPTHRRSRAIIGGLFARYLASQQIGTIICSPIRRALAHSLVD